MYAFMLADRVKKWYILSQTRQYFKPWTWKSVWTAFCTCTDLWPAGMISSTHQILSVHVAFVLSRDGMIGLKHRKHASVQLLLWWSSANIQLLSVVFRVTTGAPAVSWTRVKPKAEQPTDSTPSTVFWHPFRKAVGNRRLAFADWRRRRRVSKWVSVTHGDIVADVSIRCVCVRTPRR